MKKKAILHDHRQKKLDLFIVGANKQAQQQDKQTPIDYPVTACSCSWVEQTYDDPNVVPQIDYKNAHPWYPLWFLRNKEISKWRGKTIVSASPKDVKLEVVWSALPLSGSDIHFLGGIPYAICSDNIFVCIPEGTDKNKITHPDEDCIFEDWRFYFLLSNGDFEVIPNDMLQRYVPRYYKRIDTIDHRNIVTIKYEDNSIVLPALPPLLFKERSRKASPPELQRPVTVITHSIPIAVEPGPPIKNSNQRQSPTASVGSTNQNTPPHSSDFQQIQTTPTAMSTPKQPTTTTKSTKAPTKPVAPPPPKAKAPVVEVEDEEEEVAEATNEVISEDTNGAVFNEDDVDEDEEEEAESATAVVDEQDVEEEEEEEATTTTISPEPPATQAPKKQAPKTPTAAPVTKTVAPVSKPKKEAAPPPAPVKKPSKPQPAKKAVVAEDLEDEEDEPYVEEEAEEENEDEEGEDKEAGTEDEEDNKKQKWTIVETVEHSIVKNQPKPDTKKAAAATTAESKTNGATVSRLNLKTLKRPIGEKEAAPREPKKSKAAVETEDGDSTATTEAATAKKKSSKKADPNAPKPADKKTKNDVVREAVNALCREKANSIRTGKKQDVDWMAGKTIEEKKARFDGAWPWLFNYGVADLYKNSDPIKKATVEDLDKGEVLNTPGFKTYVQLIYSYHYDKLPIDHHTKQAAAPKPKIMDMDD
jgi:hypothetical protein